MIVTRNRNLCVTTCDRTFLVHHSPALIRLNTN